MDLFTSLLVGYTLVITVFLSVALTLQLTGHRGKFSRALLVSAAVGTIVPLATYFSYPYFFPPPVAPPPPPIDPNAPFMSQLVATFAQALPGIGQAVGYAIGHIVGPFYYGVLAIVISFSLSFLIPYRGGAKATK